MSLIIEQGLSFWMGMTLTISSLALLFNPHRFLTPMRDFVEKSAAVPLFVAWMNLSLGTFILGFHWRWDGWAMALTLIGIIALVKGVLHMFAPGVFYAVIKSMVEEEGVFDIRMRVSGLMTLLFGVAILISWWQMLS